MKKSYLLLLLCVFINTYSFAQSTAEIEAGRAMARQYGYSEQEINAVLNRNILSQSLSGREATTPVNAIVTDRTPVAISNIISEGVIIDTPEVSGSSSIYGHDLFKKGALNFIPSFNIPTPENYTLAPGDEIIINLWGEANQSITQTISVEGCIMLPLTGPIYLVGETISSAEKMIMHKMSDMHSGLKGENPSIFIKVSLGKIRNVSVNVMGDITTPGTVNIPSLSNIISVLYASGGPSTIGSVRDIKLYRNSKLIKIFDVYRFIFDADYESNIRVEDNDFIRVELYHKLVSISGSVKRPMKYELIDGESIADLLRYCGGYTSTARTDVVHLTRVKGEKIVSYDIPAEEIERFQLEDGDKLLVPSNIDVNHNQVSISGAVWYSGAYALSDTLTKLSQLLKRASVKENAFTERGYISRLNERKERVAVRFSLENIISGSEDIELKMDDQVRIFSVTELQQDRSISIRGEVNNDLSLEYRIELNLGDMVVLAGGFTDAATKSQIEIARRVENTNSLEPSDTVTVLYKINLVDNPEQINFELMPYDIITVRRAPDYKVQKTIVINGEVVFPGSHTIEKNVIRVSDILIAAGGFTKNADKRGATISRALTSDEYEKLSVALNIAREKLEDIDQQFSMLSDSSRFNIAFDIDKVLNYPGRDHDIILRDGDVINIPEINNTVRVSGAVLYANTMAYDSNMTLKDYVDMSGGYIKGAHKRKIYVVYTNGSAATKRGGKFRIEPGCEIIVPKKENNMRREISAAEVLSIATSTTSVATLVLTLVRMLEK